jgi:hypothetical protein
VPRQRAERRRPCECRFHSCGHRRHTPYRPYRPTQASMSADNPKKPASSATTFPWFKVRPIWLDSVDGAQHKKVGVDLGERLPDVSYDRVRIASGTDLNRPNKIGSVLGGLQRVARFGFTCRSGKNAIGRGSSRGCCISRLPRHQ